MYLVEYQADNFVDAEKIDYVSFDDGEVKFTFNGAYLTVMEEYQEKFINALQFMNSNPMLNIEDRHKDGK